MSENYSIALEWGYLEFTRIQFNQHMFKKKNLITPCYKVIYHELDLKK